MKIDLDIHNKLRAESNPDGSPMRDLQMTALDILVEFDAICIKHNIKYILSCGTLLGAIRHGGFIPWDDDVDVEMEHIEYKRLMKVLEGELSNNHEIHSHADDINYINTFIKIRHKEKTIKETHRANRLFNKQGIYIDIFVVEKSSWAAFKLSKELMGTLVRRPLFHKDLPKWRIKMAWGFLHNFIFPMFRILDIFVPVKLRYSLGSNFNETKKKRYYDDIIRVNFEGKMFNAPRDYEDYLTSHYGDYMDIPDERCSHSDISSLQGDSQN